MSRLVDCAIIGTGPAGLAAALQAVRQGLSVALFEKNQTGGQALAANLIENFPGFADGISGRELMKRFISQVRAHGICVFKNEVDRVCKNKHLFDIHIRTRLKAFKLKGGLSPRDKLGGLPSLPETAQPPLGFEMSSNDKYIQSLTVIVASGLVPKKLDVPGEEGLKDKRIFYYADPVSIPCRGKHVAVIGSGDAAFDQALNFSKYAGQVGILMRSDSASCIPKLAEAAKQRGIRISSNTTVAAFTEENDKLVINTKSKEETICDLAVVCIGKEEGMSFLAGDLKKDRIPGLYFAGDCIHGRHRHIAIAVGDGTLAAMKAAEYRGTSPVVDKYEDSFKTR